MKNKLTERSDSCYNTYESSRPTLEEAYEMKQGEFTANVSLSEFIKDWLENVKKCEVKPSSYDRMIRHASTIDKYPISQLKVSDINVRDVKLFISQMIERNLAYNSIIGLMQTVGSSLRFAAYIGIINRNPFNGVRRPSKALIKKPAREIVAYTHEEQEALLKVLESPLNPAHCAALLMLETGMRVGEVLALKWDDVFLERNRLKVHSTLVYADKRNTRIQEGAKSTTSNRVVPLNTRAIEILTHMKEVSNSEYVFGPKPGAFMKYEHLKRKIRNACEEAGVAYHGMHIWRHTFATNQYHKGTDVKILSKILGHSNTTITYNTYIHLYGDGFDEMLSAVM